MLKNSIKLFGSPNQNVFLNRRTEEPFFLDSYFVLLSIFVPLIEVLTTIPPTVERDVPTLYQTLRSNPPGPGASSRIIYIIFGFKKSISVIFVSGVTSCSNKNFKHLRKRKQGRAFPPYSIRGVIHCTSCTSCHC